ncbi:hypothetical protein C0J52_02765 [Blattella germanica]|nr:hypothetical protein C0J52_02765 [Blattella germanica]
MMESKRNITPSTGTSSEELNKNKRELEQEELNGTNMGTAKKAKTDVIISKSNAEKEEVEEDLEQPEEAREAEKGTDASSDMVKQIFVYEKINI